MILYYYIFRTVEYFFYDDDLAKIFIKKFHDCA